jgi:imidazolonepropionase-like amidohydrolase
VTRILGCFAVDVRRRRIEVRDVATREGRFALDGDGPAIAGAGLYLLPGLVDVHAHLLAVPAGETDPPTPVEAMSTMLRAGITSVRDVGGDLDRSLDLKRQWSDGKIPGPRPYVSGPMLSVPGGHGIASGHGVALMSAAHAREVVAGFAERGVDLIKVATSSARGQDRVPADHFAAAVEEAHARGLPVAAHAHFQLDLLELAIRLGVRSIEHGFALNREPRLADEMARAAVSLVPTLSVIDSIRRHPIWYGQKLVPAARDDARASVVIAAAAGVDVVTGTDAGVFGTPYDAVWGEVNALAELVGSRWSALAAATIAGADLLGDPTWRATFAPGDRGDAVLVRRDPTACDVDARDVVAVLQAGEVVYANPALAAPTPG